MSERQVNIIQHSVFYLFGILMTICGFLIVDKLSNIEKQFEKHTIQIEDIIKDVKSNKIDIEITKKELELDEKKVEEFIQSQNTKLWKK